MSKRGARVSTQKTVGKFLSPQQVSISTTTARSEVIDTETIRVFSDVACKIKYGGSDIDATTAVAGYDVYLPANTPYDLDIGSNQYVAAITDSGSGTLYISEVE